MSDVNYNGVSADQQAELRARIVLLDDKPSPWAQQDAFLLSFVRGPLEKLGLKGGLFPMLAKSWMGDQVDFLRHARLWAVFYLIEGKVCEHILELSLRPAGNGRVAVRFRGRRPKLYSNTEPREVVVEGESLV
jgi:hypothetical protein